MTKQTVRPLPPQVEHRVAASCDFVTLWERERSCSFHSQRIGPALVCETHKHSFPNLESVRGAPGFGKEKR